MFQILITLNNGQTKRGIYKTESEANEWLAKEVENKSFGEPEHEINAAEFGEEPVMVVVPSEYEIVGPIDISAQIEQEKINAECLQLLNETDYHVIKAMETGIPMSKEISAARALARKQLNK